MSALTPPSFIDDGGSFTKRIPHGLHPQHIAHWIDSTGSDISVYTGSFIDDGADMLLPHNAAPGFGQVDPRFYKQRKRKEGKDGVWNEDMQRAISGDMQRHLARMRGFGGVEVRRHEKGDEGEEKKYTVNVPMPPQWGTFVIKTKDGRVIVVDRDGEFDSGPHMPQKAQDGTRWIRAASTTIEPPSPTEEVSIPHPSPPHHRPSHTSKEHTKELNKKHGRSHKHKKSHHKHLAPPPLKPLTPIVESEYEDDCVQLPGGEDVTSPTNFFMTGGASWWPTKTATDVVTVTGSAPITKTYEHPVPGSPIRSPSPVRSPLGGWPSPPLSVGKNSAVSEQDWGGDGYGKTWEHDEVKCLEESEKSERLHRSRKSKGSNKSRNLRRQDSDNVSTRTYSTYKAPTVEDAPDTSSDSIHKLKKTGWGGSAKSNSVKDWNGSKTSRDDGWGGSAKAASEPSWGGSKHGSRKSWKGSARAIDDEHFTNSQAASEHGWGDNDNRSETSWDGYERVKTISEVSVAGTGSKRSSLSSQASSRQSARAPSHRSRTSQRSRTSHADSEHRSQPGWGGSQASRQSWSSEKARIDDDGWGGSQTKSDGGWGGGSKHGSERTWEGSHAGSEAKGRKYANGYDEDNETYLNENWGGTRVRVGSRRTTVAGWD